jgi:transcription elongation factor GreA
MEGKIYHVTKEKLQELKKEHAELVAQEQQKTVGEEAPKMLESEDMNPEFVAFQENMDSLRGRIEELDTIFKQHQIIKKPSSKEDAQLINIGATVHIDHQGKHDEFMIVGTLEADPVAGKISNESPVGKALLGHKVGDEIVVDSPEKTKYKVKDITYEIN